MIVQKTYSSNITALFGVGFDVVFTDIETTKRYPVRDLHLIVYIIGILRGYAIRSGRRPEGSQRPQDNNEALKL